MLLPFRPSVFYELSNTLCSQRCQQHLPFQMEKWDTRSCQECSLVNTLPVEELLRENVILPFARALYNVLQTLGLLFGLHCRPPSTFLLSLLIWLLCTAFYHRCVFARCLLRLPQQIKASAISNIHLPLSCYVVCYVCVQGCQCEGVGCISMWGHSRGTGSAIACRKTSERQGSVCFRNTLYLE